MSVSHDPFRGFPRGDAAEEEEPTDTPSEEEPEADSETESEEVEEVEEVEEEPVPSGTTKEVLAWVGDDKDRAQRALDVELADSSPRKGLVRELEEKLQD